MYSVDSLPRNTIIKTMNPLYLPSIQYSKEIVHSIIDTAIISGIDIPFAPLFRTPLDLLGGFIKYGVLERDKNHYNILSMDRNLIREASVIIPEYEEAALILRRTGYPYRGFILPVPWYYVDVFHFKNKPIIYIPETAIDFITTLMTRLITVITTYGLNLLIFIDIDDKLNKFFSRPRPSDPWTWSLFIEFMREVIRRGDAEKYGFIFYNKPSLLLIETLSSLPINFISLNPSWYTLHELHQLYRVLKEYGVYLACVIEPDVDLDEEVSKLIKLLNIFSDRLEYLSTDCNLIRIHSKLGLNGIIEYMKQLPIIVEKTSSY